MHKMLYIIWSDKNKLDIPIIDEQHRGIISTINSLHYFIQIGHGAEILTPTLTMLAQYTKIHFKTEEALLAKAKYPAIEEHCALHKTLIEKIEKLSIEVSRDRDAGRVLIFLREWWLNHINKEDSKYVLFIRKYERS
ncbi:hemerythrin family protein [bacterium]|nr:hemerythrin family protein [bacterium]